MNGSLKIVNRRRYPIALVLGLAFWWPCVFQSDFRPPAYGAFDGAAFVVLGYVFPLALMAFAAFTAFAGSSRRRIVTAPAIAAIGAAGTAGYVLQTLSGMGSFSPPLVPQVPTELAGAFAALGSLLSATYLFVFLLTWLRLAKVALPEHPLPAVALSYAVTELVQISLHFVPLEAQLAFRLACPLAASALLLVAMGTPESTKPPANRTDGGTRAVMNGILIALFAFICFNDLFSHLLKTASNPLSGAFSHDVPIPLASFAIMAILTAYLHRADAFHRRGIATAFVLTAVIYMAILLAVIVLGDSRVQLVDQLLVAAGHCLKVFVLIALVWGIEQGVCSARFAAGIFILIAVAAPLVLVNLPFLFPETRSNDTFPFAQTAGIGLFAVAVVLVVFNMRGNRHAANRTPEEQRAWLAERCRKASDGKGLTPKELEVTVFAYRGFTSKRIAEELRVSTSTVDTHLKRAFRKLDVHSRQELIDLVDAGDEPRLDGGR